MGVISSQSFGFTHFYNNKNACVNSRVTVKTGFPSAGNCSGFHGLPTIRTLLHLVPARVRVLLFFQFQFTIFYWVNTQGSLLPMDFYRRKNVDEVFLMDKKIMNGANEGNGPQGLVCESGRLPFVRNIVCTLSGV